MGVHLSAARSPGAKIVNVDDSVTVAINGQVLKLLQIDDLVFLIVHQAEVPPPGRQCFGHNLGNG